MLTNKKGPILKWVFLGRLKKNKINEDKRIILEEKKRLIEEIYERRKEYSKSSCKMAYIVCKIFETITWGWEYPNYTRI